MDKRVLSDAGCGGAFCRAVRILFHAIILASLVICCIVHAGTVTDSEPKRIQIGKDLVIHDDFLACEALPAEITDQVRGANRLECDSKWSEGLLARQKIRDEIASKFGANDWRTVEAEWRLSLAKWFARNPDSCERVLSEMSDAIARRDGFLAIGEFERAKASIRELQASDKVDDLRPWRALNLLVLGEAASLSDNDQEATELLRLARKTFEACSRSHHPLIDRIDVQIAYCLARSGAKVDTARLRASYADLAKACGTRFAVNNASLLVAQTLELKRESESAAEFFSVALDEWAGPATLQATERAYIRVVWATCCVKSGNFESAQLNAFEAKKELTSDPSIFMYPKAARTIVALLGVLQFLAKTTEQEDVMARNQMLREKTLENVQTHINYHVKAFREAGKLDSAYELQWGLVAIAAARWGEGSSQHSDALEDAGKLAQAVGDKAMAAKIEKQIRK